MTVTLQTERLILRPLRLEDAPAVYRECGNWKIARMTTRIPHPYPEGLAEKWIAGDFGEDYRFGIEHAAALVGVVGLERFGRDDDAFEIGYWIAESSWGRGLATEAVRRVLEFAFQDLGLDRVVAGHFHDNPASGRVLEKCGFRYSGEAREWSRARDGEVTCRRFVVTRETARAAEGGLRR